MYMKSTKFTKSTFPQKRKYGTLSFHPSNAPLQRWGVWKPGNFTAVVEAIRGPESGQTKRRSLPSPLYCTRIPLCWEKVYGYTAVYHFETWYGKSNLKFSCEFPPPSSQCSSRNGNDLESSSTKQAPPATALMGGPVENGQTATFPLVALLFSDSKDYLWRGKQTDVLLVC
jgi:hypothetical protein